MKKFYAILLLMIAFCAQSLSAEALLTPDPAKTYNIQHRSGLLVSVFNGKLVIKSPGADGASQKFTVELVSEGEPNSYRIKCEDGTYLGSDSGYSVKFLTDPEDAFTHFEFWASHEEGFAMFWNLGRKAYYGSDSNNDGSGIYTDKNGKDGKHAFRFIEASDGLFVADLETAIAAAKATLENYTDEQAFTSAAATAFNAAIAKAEGVVTSATTQAEVNAASDEIKAFSSAVASLYNSIVNANKALAGAVIGSGAGQYPQEAATALQLAIETAVAAWVEADAALYTSSATALNSAVKEFGAARKVFIPEAGKQYYIINVYTSLMFGMSEGGEVVLQNPTGEDCQKFEIIPVEGSSISFNFKIADGRGYVGRKGSWNTTVLENPTSNEAKIDFEVYDLEKAIYRFNKFGVTGWDYMASDDNTPGALVYTNKGASANSTWQIREVVEGELLTMALDKAIADAEAYIAEAVVGEEPGQYPQEAVDALAAALATAKAATPATQPELNDVAAALQAAIADFRAAEIDPFFVPAPNTKYRFSVRKYRDKFLTAGDADAKTTSDFVAGNAAQHWTFEPVTVADAKYTYYVKNGDKALAYDGTLVDASEAPVWRAVFTATVNNLPYFALVQNDDPTKVITFSSGKTLSVQTLSTGNDAHQARFLRVDEANDPNLQALEQAVANAQTSLDNAPRGNEVGKWNQAKCDAFQAVIDATAGLTGATQEEVDAKVAELNQARTDFLANPNSVIKDELEAAIAAAKAKAEAAEIGIEVGQYYESHIEAFEAEIAGFEAAAKEVSEQEACNALTQEVKDATEAFKGNETVQPVADVLADAITCAEKLYEAEKDNVGDNKGERPQEVVDAFAAAIAAAKAVTEPTVADLEALLDARAAFLNGAVSVNRTPLRKALATAEGEEYANLVAGDFDGNYSADAIAAFNAALAAAKEVEADMSKTQEEVDAATKALNDAMAALKKSLVVIKFEALDKAVEAAEAAVAGATVIGSEAGQCPQAVVDALKAVIAEAKAIDRAAINQESVDALVTKLTEATAKFNADLVASTGLAGVITEAEELLDGASQGFKPGEYPAAAMSALGAAIEAAKTVSEKADATQAELLAAVADLKAAMETFKGQVTPAHDLTEINKTIAEAEAFIAASGSTDFVLAMALEDAKNIVADADNYTKAEIDKANEALRKALEYAKGSAGIYGLASAEFAVKAADGCIVVTGIAADTTVAVYTLEGRLVLMDKASGAFYTVATGAGKYVVAVKGEGVAASQVVIVK